MLIVKNLTACYGDSIILRDINLTVNEAQVVCLIGRNGVGKTTFLKSLMGLVKTPEGSIKFDGTEIINMRTYRRVLRGLGYVPQGREIFPQLTVYENLVLGAEKDTLDESVLELFPSLKSMLKRKGGDLSGGQQQQLAIARALATKPKLLLLDEPTEGIQPSIIQDIAKVIKKLKKSKDVTIIIVEQYLDFVFDVSDYFFVMDKGTIVMEGNTNNANIHKLQGKIAI